MEYPKFFFLPLRARARNPSIIPIFHSKSKSFHLGKHARTISQNGSGRWDPGMITAALVFGPE